jgi:predicted transcriptional regulator
MGGGMRTHGQARNSLREEGLIRDDTPRSIWEITDKGQQWLKAQK